MPAPSADRQTVAELHREFAAKLKEQIPQVRDARLRGGGRTQARQPGTTTRQRTATDLVTSSSSSSSIWRVVAGRWSAPRRIPTPCSYNG